MAARVLITGASGYVGGRLLRALEEGGRAVRCIARDPSRVVAGRRSTEIVRGDLLERDTLEAALSGIESAVYLVHSMSASPDFAELDRRAALNFAQAAAEAGVHRIIYLGGLTGIGRSPSAHLRSRAETGLLLQSTGVPVVEFRASLVIGAGSLSFQIVQALVERLPMMICPRWVETPTQPIAIDDVVAYLMRAVDAPPGVSGVYEIGGPDVVSYGAVMQEYARVRSLRRFLIRVPLLTPRLSGLWLALVTPAQARVGRALVEGMRSATVVHAHGSRATFNVPPTPLRTALVSAIDESASSRIRRDVRTVTVNAAPGRAFVPIRQIGGPRGWYFGNALWVLRGWLDQCFGGVGMTRGRRHPDTCSAGDTIDGWTVDEYVTDRRLRLRADFLLPGRGWLEFEVSPADGGRRSIIRQTATFDPAGVGGRLYWYAVLPLHSLVFGGMLAQIARRAEALESAWRGRDAA